MNKNFNPKLLENSSKRFEPCSKLAQILIKTWTQLEPKTWTQNFNTTWHKTQTQNLNKKLSHKTITQNFNTTWTQNLNRKYRELR